ncbi:MAG TPA: hypothetical protein VJI75_04420 [Candidatus Nanoarchaeia archaeon]|nr:hypothetical protein [Candidatus Nanoarchaeia archaeon]
MGIAETVKAAFGKLAKKPTQECDGELDIVGHSAYRHPSSPEREAIRFDCARKDGSEYSFIVDCKPEYNEASQAPYQP